MNGNEHLTAREFYKGIERLEKRFDSVDAKIGDQGERLAVLEAAHAEERATVRRKTVGWGSAVAGVVMIAVEAIKAFVK